ncbi:MAG TPA: DUF2163 domain-containing protein [Sphingomicrobium sp.]|nr:DUF2163 domain-containing protein [Sphingomicrobium sp.]
MNNGIERPVATLAFCWSIERRDGAGLGLTSHDSGLHRGEQLFRAAPGILPSAVSTSLGLEPHSSEISGALTADALSEADLSLGRWDGARATLTAVDWRDPAVPATILIAGELGETSFEGEGFSVELRGASSKLNEPACPSTSPECRAEFGGKQCRVDLAGRSIRAVVASADANKIRLETAVDDRFRFGRLRYLRGANCGLATTVLAVAGDEVTMRDIPRAEVEQGCLIELREGCDKRLATCANRFNNAVNFRGEPHLPGTDLLTRYPGG